MIIRIQLLAENQFKYSTFPSINIPSFQNVFYSFLQYFSEISMLVSFIFLRSQIYVRVLRRLCIGQKVKTFCFIFCRNFYILWFIRYDSYERTVREKRFYYSSAPIFVINRKSGLESGFSAHISSNFSRNSLTPSKYSGSLFCESK